jgi:spermidine synthase
MILEQLNECDIILEHRTDYQDILITEVDGLRSLYLDGDLQFDNNNESYYHKQLVENLNEYSGGIKGSTVCVVGGGDGGCVRDLLQYTPEHITLVEIDPQIINISIKYFPNLNNMGKVFKQIDVLHMDAKEYFLRDIRLNAVILDVTIPNESSLSESLFSKSFIDTLVGKVDFLSFFISYKAVHNLDFNIFKSFIHYNAYKMYVPRYEHDGMINIVGKF